MTTFFSRRRRIAVLATAMLASLTSIITGGQPVAAITSTDLIFTQYMEGSSNNKSLEIANPTSSAIDLSGYAVERYTNGSPTVSATIALVGILNPGDVFVVSNPSANADILAVTDLQSGNANWNGDDALVLRNTASTAVIDSFGQVGNDPGSEWISGGVGTQNETLCRNDDVTGGDTDPSNAFLPDAEWNTKAIDNIDGLGDIGCSVTQDGDLLITQYVEGSSNNKALEIFNNTGVTIDLSVYDVETYNNGAITPTTTLELTGSLATGQVFVIANASANADILAVADVTSGVAGWNGNDAVVLRNEGGVVDSIGQVGDDPGSQWGDSALGTANNTLCRLDTVSDGDTVEDDPFDPSIEWEAKGNDNIDGLGEPGCLAPPEPGSVLFSQYVEGSSNNKAVEILNLGSDPVDLSLYDVERYSNGGTTPTAINLVGILGSGEVFVLANPSANADILAVADLTNGNANWNGDDALVLRDGAGNVADVIGQVGFDPGSQWGDAALGTANNTLCRLDTVTMGDTIIDDVFDPSIEWEAKGNNNIEGLGNPTCEPQPIGDLLLTQYMEGSGSNKAVEIANLTGATIDLSDYTVELRFNGQTTGPSIALSGTLADQDVFVIANGNASAAILAVTDLISGSASWNGNDAIFLQKTSTGAVVDSLGQVGFNPGIRWGDSNLGTLNDSLCRIDTVTSTDGDTVEDDVFDPSVEWISLGNDSIIGLGEVGCVDTTPGECGSPATFIHDIQGSGTVSPLEGSIVIIEGVVVGDFQEPDQIGGFFVQEEDADADADSGTSEGIYVFEGTPTIPVDLGDIVRVRGEVDEFFELTEVTNVTGVVGCSDATGTATPASLTLPYPEGFDFENLEGMAVDVMGPLVVTDSFNAGRFGQIRVSVNDPLVNPTQAAQPGAAANAVAALNDRSQILLDDGRSSQNPAAVAYFGSDGTVRRGDRINGPLQTVLSYSFGEFGFQPRFDPTVPDIFTRLNPRPTGPPDLDGDLTIASFNVLNYFTTLNERGADTAEELTRQRDKIIAAVTQLNADVIGLIELENNGTAIADLVAGFNDATSPGTYDYINTGSIGTDAITVGIVYKPASVTPVGAFAILDSSVDARFIDSKNRPSLVQTFEDLASGERFNVSINHFKSKGSPCDDVGDPDAGDEQGNCNLTRTSAAEALVDFMASDPTATGTENALILGDINAYPNEDPLTAFTNGGFIDLLTQQVPNAQSFVFFGEGGRLDHALVNPALAPSVVGADEWSINAAEPRALDYNVDINPPGLYDDDPFRSSDHDPVLVALTFEPPQALMVVGSVKNGQPPKPDRDILAKLQDLGFEVMLVNDDDATAADADGKRLVVISSTVVPNKIDDEFTEVPVPLVSWEGHLFDELRFNTPGGGRNGMTSSSQKVIEITDPNHPMSAGYSGTTSVLTTSRPFSFSEPEGDAQVVAMVGNDSVLFGYEAGAGMSGQYIAPARRVGLFPDHIGADRLTQAGMDIVVAAFGWAVNASGVPANNAPEVDAGSDEVIIATGPVSVELDATVDDDGRPVPPSQVTQLWTSPDAGVSFDDATAVDTTVNLPGPGVYELTLEASDSELETSDTVTVTVALPGNEAPEVDAGEDMNITLPTVEVALDGTVTDDGLPLPPTLTISWNQVSGPAGVTFAPGDAEDTVATFPGAGQYILSLVAFDGVETTDDLVTINVLADPPSGLSIAYVAGSDGPPRGDRPIVDHFTENGSEVTVVDDDDADEFDFSEFDLIFVSTSVAPSKVDGLFRDVPVPLITTEQFLLDDTMMAVPPLSKVSSKSVQIVSPASPLAAGLDGSVVITDTGTSLGRAQPADSALIVATVGGDPVYFAYEGGEAMVDGFVAPADRIFFPGAYQTAREANANYFALLDAAVVEASATQNLPG